MPKPAAAFSALAMTRSIWWCSTSAGEAAPDELAPGPADDVADEEDAHHDGPAMIAIDRERSAVDGDLIARPRRSAIFGTEMRSSPSTSVRARAGGVARRAPSRTTRAKRPKPRSTR